MYKSDLWNVSNILLYDKEDSRQEPHCLYNNPALSAQTFVQSDTINPSHQWQIPLTNSQLSVFVSAAQGLKSQDVCEELRMYDEVNAHVSGL